jgi:hypothetical protein
MERAYICVACIMPEKSSSKSLHRHQHLRHVSLKVLQQALIGRRQALGLSAQKRYQCCPAAAPMAAALELAGWRICGQLVPLMEKNYSSF